MGMFFIWITLIFGFGIGYTQLRDIVIELRFRNTLLKEQNEILKEDLAFKEQANRFVHHHITSY
jgi:hypothetical protein